MEKKHKVGIVVAIIVGLSIIVGAIIAKSKAPADNDSKYLDAMRKCTVMEAADIYTTGIGGDKSTAFEDAKETCKSWHREWLEKDFYDSVYEDWENRKTETIEGKNLDYYLNVLGW